MKNIRLKKIHDFRELEGHFYGYVDNGKSISPIRVVTKEKLITRAKAVLGKWISEETIRTYTDKIFMEEE